MTQTVEWKISNKLIDYDFAISVMEKRVLNIKRNSEKELVILSLSDFDIYGVRIKNQPGVWVNTNNRFDKIAALGIRISSWITYHGISINLNPNLEEFKNIVPCGIKDSGITSLHKLNKKVSLDELDNSLKKYFEKIFGENGSFFIK